MREGEGDDRRLWGKGEEGEKIIGPFGVSMGWLMIIKRDEEDDELIFESVFKSFL